MYLTQRSPANLGAYIDGVRSPANLGIYLRGRRSPSNLGYFRPNQAFDRGIYGLGCSACKNPGVRGRDARRRGMGDDSNFLAAGSTLSYTAQWPTVGANGQTSLFVSGSGIVSAISPTLTNQWGINILSEFDSCNFFSCGGFTLQITITRDYGTAADVKSILDSVVGSAVGNPGMIGQGYGSNISLVQGGATPTATGAASTPTAQAQAAIVTQYQQAVAAGDSMTAQSLLTAYPSILAAFGATQAAASITTSPLTWLTQNWQWVGVGAIAVVFLPRLLK